MFAAFVCCLDLFTMQHAQHHKSGIAWLLSGITGLVFEFFIKLLYWKTNKPKKKKKTFHQPLARKDHLTHTFAGHTFLCSKVFFLIYLKCCASSWINKWSDRLCGDRDTWAFVFSRWESHWHSGGKHKSRKSSWLQGGHHIQYVCVCIFKAVICLISKLFILYRAAAWFRLTP